MRRLVSPVADGLVYEENIHLWKVFVVDISFLLLTATLIFSSG